MRALSVWMNGERVGTWSIGTTGNHRLAYDPQWVVNPKARPLSLSLPFTAGLLEGDKVRNFFDNLLPDSEAIRKRIGTRYRLRRIEVFALLQAIGRDCVGAVQILPLDAQPEGFDQIRGTTLTHRDIEQIIGQLGATPGAGTDDEDEFRLSLAGAQEKTALLQVDGHWMRPRGATPTTHILKPPIGVTAGRNLDLRLSVENEWLCSQIAQELGLETAESEIVDFGARRALVVKRFDRALLPQGWIARLPQEDLCQALGVAGSAKYEKDGGPGIEQCLEVLKASEDPHGDGRTFLCAQLLFWLMAAIDGHAKNFSLFILPQGRYRLTPLYDVLSAWPLIGSGAHHLPYQKAKMAMAVRGSSAHYRLGEIQRRHWQALAHRSGIDQAWEAMLDMVGQLEGALVAVERRLPADFPADMAQQIFAGTRRHLTKFEAG